MGLLIFFISIKQYKYARAFCLWFRNINTDIQIMKKIFYLIIFCSLICFPQNKQVVVMNNKNTFSIFAGMGINRVAPTDVVKYINSISLYSDQVSTFATAVDFFGGIEFPISDGWGLKIEHSYLFSSYNVAGKNNDTYNFFYAVNAPSVIVQKIITGHGYFLKFGGGGGYHFGSAEQKSSLYGADTKYSSRGIGIKADAVGQTAFDENLFAYIGATAGWEFVGDLKDANGNTLYLLGTTNPVSLNYFYVGIRFGLSFYF